MHVCVNIWFIYVIRIRMFVIEWREAAEREMNVAASGFVYALSRIYTIIANANNGSTKYTHELYVVCSNKAVILNIKIYTI